MKNITLKFSVEIDGETFAKVAKCIKDYEPEIFNKMHEQFKPQFDKILNGEIRESGDPNCPLCHGRGEYSFSTFDGSSTTTRRCNCGQFGLERT